jgi:hypothetical protein
VARTSRYGPEPEVNFRGFDAVRDPCDGPEQSRLVENEKTLAGVPAGGLRKVVNGVVTELDRETVPLQVGTPYRGSGSAYSIS